MNLSEIKDKAMKLGIKLDDKSKADLIREIQRIEGYSSCFGNLSWDCPQKDCCWRFDCLGIMGRVPNVHVFDVIF